MDRSRFLALLILMFAVPSCQGRELRIGQQDNSDVYNHTLATILVEYASASNLQLVSRSYQCDGLKSLKQDMTLTNRLHKVQLSDLNALITWTCSRCKDLTEGFQVIELIVDIQNCLQSFVGIDHGLNAIIIAFRGTQKLSIRNWIDDLLWKQLDLNYPDMPDAMVHHGFYAAYHNTTLRPGVVSAVQRAKELYGDIPVIITGHSMGGAIASFCALDLTINFGIHNAQLMTFGQPRVGNAAFASYFSKHVPRTVRVTNGHDIVPHLPPYYSYFPHKTYHHFPREVWIHNSRVSSTLVYTAEKICDESGEDPSCSRSVTGNSIMDHLTYMGVDMRADSSDSCGIVFYNDETLHCHEDIAGNFVLSK